MSTKMIAERKDVPDENKWVLTPLFETDGAWDQLFSEVEKALERYGDYRGRLKDAVSLFKEATEFHLGKILRYKPHTRSESEEQILAMSRELAGAPSQVFGQLDNVDLKFGTVTDESGNEIELSHGNFTTFLINPRHDIRKKVFFQYYQAYQDHKHTLAHEAGHSLHSYFSKKHQPYVDHDYTIFVAEVASTFNEDLLSRYLLEFYKDDPKMKAYILNREIDNIRATLFRQTMFAEFENTIHAIGEANEPLTLDVMTEQYHQLLETYFGDTLVLDPELSLECLRIPHFYSAFYVYKYATGVSAAIALADKVVNEGDPARQAYLDFLKLGGSQFPLDELRDAGVDMGSPEPVKRAINQFSRLVDELVEVYTAAGDAIV